MSEATTGAPCTAHLCVRPVKSGSLEEFQVSVLPMGEADAASQTRSMYRRVLKALPEPSTLRIVAERAFGDLHAKATFLRTRSESLKAAGCSDETPVTYLQCAPTTGSGLAGLQMTLVRSAEGVRIQALKRDGKVRGYCVESDGMKRVFLPGVQGMPESGEAPGAEAQAATMFERAAKMLADAGLEYHHVCLTRIYLKRLLEWYSEFNGVRNPFYRKVGLSGQNARYQVPASTGIQGRISDACEVVMDVTAMSHGKPDECPFVRLRNPLQNEATDYGSGFARGVSVKMPGAKYVLISGTASIDEKGVSVHVDDAVEQSRRTMDNFKAITEAGGATLDELYHAVWYCKDASYAKIVRQIMAEKGWPEFPYIFVVADVCRHDLLVEIDGAAVVTG